MKGIKVLMNQDVAKIHLVVAAIFVIDVVRAIEVDILIN